MKFSFKTLALCAATVGISAMAHAQDPWLNIYYPGNSTFHQYEMSEVQEITFDEATGKMRVEFVESGKNPFTVGFENLSKWVIGSNPIRFDMNTDNGAYEVSSKTTYLAGELIVTGHGITDDVVISPAYIRGRGNSTWGYSKKPYRLHFDEKSKLVSGFKKAKNYVLLANYIDPSMMRNWVAFQVGNMVGLPYTNTCIPVEMYLNGNYKGSYMFTQKVGINNGSVDLAKEDEANSVMFELDSNSADYDEYPFKSTYYRLPVKFKDPDPAEDYNEANAWRAAWEEDFLQMEKTLYQANNDPAKIFTSGLLDLESLVRYIIMNNIACNQELDHPKSVFIYKVKGGPWCFGPGWDFDWAYGYSPTYSNWGRQSYENPLLATGRNEGGGGEFFLAMVQNDVFKARFEEIWGEFYANQAEFWRAFDDYAASLEPGAILNGEKYSNTRNFDSNIEELRHWVQGRIEFINSDANHGIW